MALPAELALITSEHAGKPNFVASVAASIQGISDTGAVLATLAALFDLDSAVGAQLDVDGQWIGQTRDLDEVLDDDIYRALLYGTIGENQWDGSIPAAYAYLAEVFGQFDTQPAAWVNAEGQAVQWTNAAGQDVQWSPEGDSGILIQSYPNASMAIAVVGDAYPEVLMNLLIQGRLSPRPAGVRCFYLMQSQQNTPYFGLDAETATVSGLDVGALATIVGDSAAQ